MEKLTKNQKTIVKEVGSSGLVTLQISRFDKFDSDDDRMMKGAFNKTFKDGKQVHLVDHKVGVSTLVGLPIRKDADNLIIDSQLNLGKTIGQELLSDYEFCLKHGRSLQHSQGFVPVKYEKNSRGGYDFQEVNMKEYSTVVFGAENDTPLHAIKNAKQAQDYIDTLLERCKFGFMTDEQGYKLEALVKQIKHLINEPSFDTQNQVKQEVVTDTSIIFLNHLN